MKAAQKEALRGVVAAIAGPRVEVKWATHQPERVAPVRVRLTKTSDTLQGGDVERERVVQGSRYLEKISARRLALITVLVEQFQPAGEEACDIAARIAMELHRPERMRALREAGLILLGGPGSVVEIPVSADSRVLLSVVTELRFRYTMTDEGETAEPQTWIESAPVDGDYT